MGFQGKGRQGQSKQFKIGYLNNSGETWGTGVIFSCLEPGPGMIRAEEYCGVRHIIWIKQCSLLSRTQLLSIQARETLVINRLKPAQNT